jgi:hypothetical protein
MKNFTFCIAVLGVSLVSLPAPGGAQSGAPKPAAVYFAAYRTPAHVKYSKPEVFHQIVAGVAEYLETHRVVIAKDPDRKRIESADLIPKTTLVNIARETGASSLLLLTVDRPKTKWVKITAEACDLSGATLWKETVDEGGGLSGKGGVEKALEKLQKRLEPRLGQPGLEQATASEQKASTAPTAQ